MTAKRRLLSSEHTSDPCELHVSNSSIWLCLQAAADATFTKGGISALVVLTASHSKKMSLADVKDLVQTASSKARKGRNWINAQEGFGIHGVICGPEVTYSKENGWHYHQHLSVLIEGPTAVEIAAANGDAEKLRKFVANRAQAAGDWLTEAYKEKIRDAGGKVSDKHGCKVRVAHDAADASEYTSKGSMAWELAGGHKDETKAEASMTPWDIANRAADGDKFMYARWKEYEAVMPGTRSCVVSAALAKKLGIVVEDASEGQVLHQNDDVVGHVVAPLWKRWMRHGLASTFLLRVEYGGDAGFSDAGEQTNADSDVIGKEKDEETVADLLARLDVQREDETVARLERLDREAAEWREGEKRYRAAAEACRHRYEIRATPANIAEIAGERIRQRADAMGQRAIVTPIVDELVTSYGVRVAEADALRVAKEAPNWMREIEAIMPGRWLSDDESAALRMAA